MFITPTSAPAAAPGSGGPSKRAWIILFGALALIGIVVVIVWLRSRGEMAPLVSSSTSNVAAPVEKAKPNVSPQSAPRETPVFPVDTDGDGVSDTDEAAHKTDPVKGDTDGDGFSDFEEIYSRKTDPLKPDPPLVHPMVHGSPAPTSP